MYNLGIWHEAADLDRFDGDGTGGLRECLDALGLQSGGYGPAPGGSAPKGWCLAIAATSFAERTNVATA
jgi:hypothetical protein